MLIFLNYLQNDLLKLLLVGLLRIKYNLLKLRFAEYICHKNFNIITIIKLKPLNMIYLGVVLHIIIFNIFLIFK